MCGWDAKGSIMIICVTVVRSVRNFIDFVRDLLVYFSSGGGVASNKNFVNDATKTFLQIFVIKPQFVLRRTILGTYL